ncbi:MAG: HutD family protein [Caldimonas sp.]
MNIHCVSAAQIAPQAWKNSGGRTRELLAWPAAAEWTLRISLAEIDADGPFSAFAGVTRWFAVVEGAGVALAFDAAEGRAEGSDGVERRIAVADAPLRFDGAQAPHCRLLAGATRDLNLMARDGDAAMRRAHSGVEWSEPFEWRGLFTRSAGRWSAGAESIRLAPLTLLWSDTVVDGTAWRFDADDAEGADDGANAGDAADVTHAADAAARTDAADHRGRASVCGWWLGFTPQASQRGSPR